VGEVVRRLSCTSFDVAVIVVSDATFPFALGINHQSSYFRIANTAAYQSDTEYVAFIESTLLHDEGTLTQMVDWMESNRQLASVTAVSRSTCPTRQMILMPDVRMTVIRREALLKTDGFDESYCGRGETLDLGWRWWLMGYHVGQMPATIETPTRTHSTNLTPDKRYGQAWRNWLWTVLKNRGDAHWSNEITMALAELLTKAYRDAQLEIAEQPAETPPKRSRWQRLVRWLNRTDTVSHLRISPDDPTVPLANVPHYLVTALVTANDIVEAMPVLMRVRQQIQTRRQRSDAEIERLLGVDLPTLVKASFLEAEGI
jgi:hypothetical protein